MTGTVPDVAAAGLRRDRPAPPVRIVHLGLGAFSRSHLAWYTARADDAEEWGISAYTGRSRELAEALRRQDGVYTLVVRDAEGDRTEIVQSIVEARSGDDVDALLADLAAGTTAVVTLTITERGYRSAADGAPDADDPLVADDLALLAAAGGRPLAGLRPRTALGKLVLGLEERRRRGGGDLAVLSLDNVPDNGGRLERAVRRLAAELSPELEEWVTLRVAFPSSSVDRITPGLSTDELGQLVGATGDLAPVVAEPFSDWIVSGRFPAGRPQWETSGVRFVDDLHAWEARKLWMLNGAHTLLACLGLLRGHDTVAEAIADPVCRRAVEELWDEDASCLPDGLDLERYRAALLARFANPRIEHRLLQIAADSFTKLRLRIAPVARIRLGRGAASPATALVVAAWIVADRRGLLPADPSAQLLDGAAATVRDALELLDPALAVSADYAGTVESFGNRLSSDAVI